MPVWLIILIILIVILIAALVIRCSYELRTLTISRYDISSEKLPEEEKIKAVFISDLHGCRYGEKNCELVEMIRGEAPDVILIGGDLIVSKNARMDPYAREFIREITGIAPIFYAPGNHERALEALHSFRSRNRNYMNFLRMQGVHYLKNKTEDISSNVSVTGLDFGYEYYAKVRPRKMTSEDMAAYLGKLDKNRYNIVLAHNPGFFDKYIETDADLVLSGHYHGGAIRLPLIGGIISPQFRLFPDHSKGKFTENGTTMIVTGGCGSHTVNIRINNKPEIIALTISGR